MIITDEMKKELAILIQEELKKEFETVHFTGNLMNTIKIYKTDKGWNVDIPAERYLFSEYVRKGVLIKYGHGGSYASKINTTGGFSGKHKGYVERCIDAAVIKWLSKYQIRGKVK